MSRYILLFGLHSISKHSVCDSIKFGENKSDLIAISTDNMVSTKRVDVKQGRVIGGEGVLPNGKRYYYFKGIPYAVPPLGELRFKAPVPLAKFSAPVIKCLKEGPASIQHDTDAGNPFTGSEDCLYLNVYTPECNPSKLLPVMLYIHGGGNVTGNGNSDKHNPLYLMQEEVVVVTFNYRLGVLGFLVLPEANIPGNAGLKDQVLVMKWVRDNISKFNGDPNNITLFGQSSGGSCAHMHLFSENSKKLFHKAIMQSGVATLPFLMNYEGSSKTRSLAKLIGCTSDDPHILKFLQNFNDLQEFLKPMVCDGRPVFDPPMPTKPVIEEESEEAVITKSLFEAMKDPDSVQVPILIGYTSAEGLSRAAACGENLKDFHNNFHELIPPELIDYLDDEQKMNAAKSIREFYFNDEQIDSKMTYQLSKLLGDFTFSSYIREAVELHTRYQHKSPLYFFRFDFDGQLNLYKRKHNAAHLRGASHVDDLCYVFQMVFGPEEPWEEDTQKMVLTMCKMWTNFAKYSNPTPTIDKVCGNCEWEPVPKVDNWKDMVIKALIFDKEIKMMDNPDEDRMTFWRNLKNYHK